MAGLVYPVRYFEVVGRYTSKKRRSPTAKEVCEKVESNVTLIKRRAIKDGSQ